MKIYTDGPQTRKGLSPIIKCIRASSRETPITKDFSAHLSSQGFWFTGQDRISYLQIEGNCKFINQPKGNLETFKSKDHGLINYKDTRTKCCHLKIYLQRDFAPAGVY
jgi:hypothetical protein